MEVLSLIKKEIINIIILIKFFLKQKVNILNTWVADCLLLLVSLL